MKFLIAVSSCQADAAAGDHDAIRKTWGRVAEELSVPYIITIGGGASGLGAHEFSSEVPDDYPSLPLKTCWNIRFALRDGFDYIFQCFKDTYISIPRLLAAAHELRPEQQIVGNFFFHGIEEGHPCGGAGYWMGREMMRAMIEATPQTYEEANNAEDRLTGIVMQKHGIQGWHDSRYDHVSMRGGVSLFNNNITNHLWTHYNYYQQNLMGFADWNRGWILQEHRQELTGEVSEQNQRRRERVEDLMKANSWVL